MFDHSKASQEQIQARLEKFKRKAPQIIDQDHFDQILNSFPEDQRQTVFNAVRPLINFAVTLPTAEQFRLAAMSCHEYEAEIQAGKHPEELPARLERFKEAAPRIPNQLSFDQILWSFPLDQRWAIFNEVSPLLAFIPDFHGA